MNCQRFVLIFERHMMSFLVTDYLRKVRQFFFMYASFMPKVSH